MRESARRGVRDGRPRPHARVVLIAVWLGVLVPLAAQAPAARRADVVDAAGFRAIMRQAGADWAVVAETVDAPIYLLNGARGDALGRVERMRTDFEAVRRFLAGRQQTDAARAVEETLDGLGFMRTTLARAEPDQTEAQEIASAVGRACAACHAVYREGDAAKGFRARAGLIE